MTEIRLGEELWQNGMLPEGILERWFVADGERVAAGAKLAEVRIESARHEIMAPTAGALTILAAPNSVVEPGTVVGRLAS